MDIEQLIKELEAKIDALKLQGEAAVARVIGEYNGRVAELQETVKLLQARQVMAAAAGPVAPESAAGITFIDAPAA